MLVSHLRVPRLAGGYAGVDVFFVISGYVIFGDLLRRARSDQPWIRAFYLRRLRRLAPQLVALSLAVCLIGLIVLLPSELGRLPGRVSASLLGWSNWLFAYQTGYFMAAADGNPLLHTWTLAVELQFYLICPLLILALARGRPRRLGLAVAGASLISLGYALWPNPEPSALHYFDSLGRFWEFLAGGALHLFTWRFSGRRMAETASFAAITALALVFAFLTRDAAYPDWRTLVPVLATAMLVLALPTAPSARRMLARAPLSGIGRASYSIYVWHWPVVMFFGYLWPVPACPRLALAVQLMAIGLISFVMYRLIEVPLRDPARVAWPRFYRIMGATLLVLLAILGSIQGTRGWPSRLGPAELSLDDQPAQTNRRRNLCHRPLAGVPLPLCRYGAARAATIAVWSDSHGVELIAAMEPGLKQRNLSAAQLSFSSCAPTAPTRIASACDQFNHDALAWIVANRAITTVVLAAALDSPEYGDYSHWQKGFTAAITQLAAAGKRIVLVYPVVRQPYHVPQEMANRLRFGIDETWARTRRADYMERTLTPRAALDSVTAPRTQRVWPDRILCPDKLCPISNRDVPLYFDDNRLTLVGASLIAGEVLIVLDKV